MAIFQGSKLQCANVFQDSACVMFAKTASRVSITYLKNDNIKIQIQVSLIIILLLFPLSHAVSLCRCVVS